jgi:hypothetical protein
MKFIKAFLCPGDSLSDKATNGEGRATGGGAGDFYRDGEAVKVAVGFVEGAESQHIVFLLSWGGV